MSRVPCAKVQVGNYEIAILLIVKSFYECIYFLIKTVFKKGKSVTCAATETISLSIQHENANSSQVAKTQFVEAAYSEASGDLRFLTLSDRYIVDV